MGNVIILEETTKKPITLIGKRAGICWGADIFVNSAINSGVVSLILIFCNFTPPYICKSCVLHHQIQIDSLMHYYYRRINYVNVEMILDEYSARVIREWYTHLGGSPTRLQASTRYIDYEHGFNYVVPESVRNDVIIQ